MPISENAVIELDEIWYFFIFKKINFGYGKHTAVIMESLLTGNVVIEIQEH